LLLVLAIIGVPRAQTDTLFASVPLGLLGAAALVNRRETLALTAVALIGAAQFSIRAFTGVPVAVAGDLIIGAVWIAVIYGWLIGARRPPRWFTAGLGLLGLYVLASVLSALLNENVTQGFYGFRVTGWYMTLALLGALAFPGAKDRRRLFEGLLIVAVLTCGYAALRWAIGPAGAEQDAIASNPNDVYVRDEFGEILLFGSLPGAPILGLFCVTAIPAGLAAAMAPIAMRMRLLGIAVVALAAVDLVGADKRTAMVASAAAAAVVVALVLVAPAFAGRRLVPLALVGLAIACAGGGWVVTKLDEQSASGERFRNIFHPFEDESIQGRLTKWKTTLADLKDHPFGYGLGSTGIAQQKYSRWSTIGNFSPDSGYVKVAYEQGYAAALLFIVAIILLLVGLGSVAIRAPGTYDSTIAVAACGTLAGVAVDLVGGSFQEGQSITFAWILVGIGLAPLLHPTVEPED
jgi:hypothetical protein